MTERTEREAVARIICTYDLSRLVCPYGNPCDECLPKADLIIAEHIAPLRSALKEAERERADTIELKRIDASLEDVLGDLERYETRSDAVAEVCRMAKSASLPPSGAQVTREEIAGAIAQAYSEAWVTFGRGNKKQVSLNAADRILALIEGKRT